MTLLLFTNFCGKKQKRKVFFFFLLSFITWITVQMNEDLSSCFTGNSLPLTICELSMTKEVKVKKKALHKNNTASVTH